MTGNTFDTSTTQTIILSGLKIGNVVKLSSDVTIRTDTDQTPSQTMPFGNILAHSVVFEPALSAAALIAGASQSFTRAPSPNPPTPFFLATQRTQKALRLLLHTPPVIPRLSTQITVSMLAPHARLRSSRYP